MKFLTCTALLMLPASALAQDPHLGDTVDVIAAEVVTLSSKIDGVQSLLGWLLGAVVVIIIALVWAGGRR